MQDQIGKKQQPSGGSSSSTKDNQGASKSQILFANSDGSVVEAVIFRSGAIGAQVLRRWSGGTKILGILKHMLDAKTGHQSLQAICKVHSNCRCWITNANHCDLLLNWLGVAEQNVQTRHCELASELKSSIGMKVRSKK